MVHGTLRRPLAELNRFRLHWTHLRFTDWLPLPFSLAIALGSALLFVVEPMFARMALPLLGGAPSVWNTAMVFYQLAVLLGYLYAHYATERLPAKQQAVLHLLLLLAAVVVLPIAIPLSWQPPVDPSPVPWLLSLMLVRLGPPFVLLSATSPMLQKWFAGTAHPSARDPYFLYAASNLGSLAGLLSYPLVVEPYVRLRDQSLLWAQAYFVFVALVLGCALLSVLAFLRRSVAPGGGDSISQLALLEDNPTLRRRLRWVILAFLPSSLMLGVTTYISTDIASFPLLWVVPLALYLLTFVLAFARRRTVPSGLLAILAPILLVVLVVSMLLGTLPIGVVMLLHLATFFVIALACHSALADDRPPSDRLTEFYLWLAVGGALGGIFNALLAPILFKTVIEYSLGLVLAALLIRRPGGTSKLYTGWLDIALPALLLALLALGLLLLRSTAATPVYAPVYLIFLLVPTVVCFSSRRRPLRFALGLAAFLLATTTYAVAPGANMYTERSFFGINRVVLDAEHGVKQLVHGSTLHGMQSLDPARRCQPMSYYYPTGPIGQLFAAARESHTLRRVGVIGLGAGSLAAYARPGQEWTFFEIDPSVVRIAQDRRYFTFLSDCAPSARIVLGDGRLSLGREPPGQYDLIVVDAYSSDAIPVHLLTREALKLYLDKLAPGGLIAFNISNRHLDLRPIVGNLAHDAGLCGLAQLDASVGQAEARQGKTGSLWVLLARSLADFGVQAADARWQTLAASPGSRVWTDDYSSIVSTIRWR